MCAPGFVSNIELYWDEPALATFFGRLASFSRLILFDKRGKTPRVDAPRPAHAVLMSTLDPWTWRR